MMEIIDGWAVEIMGGGDAGVGVIVGGGCELWMEIK